MKKDKGGKRYLLMLLLLAAAVTSLFANSTMAKYSTSFTGSGAVNVAAFAGGADTADFDVTVSGLSPGRTSTVPFAVQNYEGDRSCEVALTYEIQVETTGNLPLGFSLLAPSMEDADPYNQPVGQLTATDTENLKYTATGGRLPVAVGDSNDGLGQKRHVYELAITWPEAEHDWDYSKEIDMITVTVTATQADPGAEV